MKKRFAAFVAAALLASGAGASEPATMPATVNADPALWVVKDADTTIYLFGTVHLMRPEVQWFDGGVKAAFDAASELVLEIEEPDSSTAANAIGKRIVDPDGPPLSQKLSTKSAAALKTALQANNIPLASIEQLEPWYVATLLGLIPLQEYGLSPDSGIDKVLSAKAKSGGKRIIGLETMEQQLDYFDKLPEPLQIIFLEETVKGLPDYGKMVDTMIKGWTSGKPEKMSGAIDGSMKRTPEIRKLLLGDRNARWADWIKARMDRPGTAFVAVGAGHLAGKDSVQRMLKKHKLKAVRIPS